MEFLDQSQSLINKFKINNKFKAIFGYFVTLKFVKKQNHRNLWLHSHGVEKETDLVLLIKVTCIAVQLQYPLKMICS